MVSWIGMKEIFLNLSRGNVYLSNMEGLITNFLCLHFVVNCITEFGVIST